MPRRLRLTLPALLALACCLPARAADPDPFRVLDPGKVPADARLAKPRDLHPDSKDDGHTFPFHVPATKEAWEARRKELREQVLVATGLWPLPEKTPLDPVIHGKIDRDDYTIEKVFFASMPGHYVSGNLYRPKGKTGKLPAVLFPHGHWGDARFYDAGEAEGKKLIDGGGEKTIAGARYHLQAPCAMLARMGCVVFHYDMVGHSDSKDIAHTQGFLDASAELRLQSFMGLQTWNSIRALDFVTSLPEVDPQRIGVTGASGGGTQTFILCAVDDRPAAAFPAVMVSTTMQGGCICENCSLLRQDTNNVEIAGLFAPKPLAMTGANDWTIAIETKGLPELKELYKLYGAEDNVMARCFPKFGHNYNQVSREVMYNWFNKHLKLGWKDPVEEKPFEPVFPTKELSVYDKEHPHPADALKADELRKKMTEASDKQIEALIPRDAAGLKEFQRVIGTALRVMIHDGLPKADEVEAKEIGDKQERDGVTFRRYLLTRKGAGEQLPAVGLAGKEFDGTVVVWVHPAGKASLWQDGKLAPAARAILDKKAAILAPDVYLTGEFADAKPEPINKNYANYAGYNYGYNRTLLANRVHDVLTAVAFAKGHEKTKAVDLVGFEKAGPWVVLARGLCGDAVTRTAADFDQFRFEKVDKVEDEMLLPGGLKYGGLPAFAALAAPGELYLHNHQGTGVGQWVKAAYAAAGAKDRLEHSGEKVNADKVVAWLLR
jgi:dienelactone hydrolase